MERTVTIRTLRCDLCGGPVDPNSPYVWHRVEGWERKATAGSRKSGSDIALREPREGLAHDQCVRRARDGVSPLQETLV